jgi:hypothetical protein
MANKVITVKEVPNSRAVVNGDTYLTFVDAESQGLGADPGTDEGSIAAGYLSLRLPGNQASPAVDDTFTLTVVAP